MTDVNLAEAVNDLDRFFKFYEEAARVRAVLQKAADIDSNTAAAVKALAAKQDALAAVNADLALAQGRLTALQAEADGVLSAARAEADAIAAQAKADAADVVQAAKDKAKKSEAAAAKAEDARLAAEAATAKAIDDLRAAEEAQERIKAAARAAFGA